MMFCEANISVLQINMFLDRLHGDPIGFSVLGIFIIEKNTILTVRGVRLYYHCVRIILVKLHVHLVFCI